MEAKRPRRKALELSHFALHGIGGICLLGGGVSAVLQRRFFDTGVAGTGEVDQQLLSILDGGRFDLATLAIFCQLAELAAIPIFAFLLANGVTQTASFRRYFLRVLALAAVCEIPYSLVYNGVPFAAVGHNAAFGALMALAVLWFFRTFPRRTAAHVAVKALAVVGGVLWCNFLGVAHGAATVILAAVLWATRDRPIGQTLAGMGACLALVVFSPFYFISALGLIAVHMYSGKKGYEDRLLTYLFYPFALAASLALWYFL